MFHDRPEKLEIARNIVQDLPYGSELWLACGKSAVAMRVSIKGKRAIFCVEDSRYPDRVYAVSIFEQDRMTWVNANSGITTVKMSPRPFFLSGPREGTIITVEEAISTFVTVLESRARQDEVANQLISELIKK